MHPACKLGRCRRPRLSSPGRCAPLVPTPPIQTKPPCSNRCPAVWDSSIVLSKMLELHAPRFAGRRCLDLSAGCGLPGIVLAKLGAEVTATDLAPNLPLLEKNAAANGGWVGSTDWLTARCWGAMRVQCNTPMSTSWAQACMWPPLSLQAARLPSRSTAGAATRRCWRRPLT